MRNAFVDELSRLAEADPDTVLITGDLGFGVFEDFEARFPKQFVNAGVAEQNMIGVATGLAEGGFIPYAYSIASFAALRPYEFFRNGPVHHHLPVRLVGVGGGLEYDLAGPTHHSLEDLAVMRPLPGLTVIAPADAALLERFLHEEDEGDLVTLPPPAHPTPLQFRLLEAVGEPRARAVPEPA